MGETKEEVRARAAAWYAEHKNDPDFKARKAERQRRYRKEQGYPMDKPQYDKQYYAEVTKHNPKIREKCRAAARASYARQKKLPGHYLKMKKNSLWQKYKLTLDAFEYMFELQEGLCAICLQPERSRGKTLAVDHCHRTGQVRQLLCSHCNKGIGHLGDDPRRVLAAALYLERHNNRPDPRQLSFEF